MIKIMFSDRENEKQVLAYMLGRFSGHVFSSGAHLIPEAALIELARQNISFAVIGKSTYGEVLAAVSRPSRSSS